MTLLEDTIQRVRDAVPTFGGRCSGAASVEKVLNFDANYTLPFACVVDAGERAEETVSPNKVQQLTNRRFVIVVAIDNSDAAGFASVVQSETIRAEIHQAFLGWKPEWAYRKCIFVGSDMLELNANRLFHQYEFEISEWVHETPEGENAPPADICVGKAPDVGPGNEDKYTRIGG